MQRSSSNANRLAPLRLPITPLGAQAVANTTMQQELLCMHRVECYEQCHTPTLIRWRITERAGTRPRCAPSLISPGMHGACTTLRSRPTTRGCRLPQQQRHRCARARPACAPPCPGGHMAPPRLERGPRGNSLQLRLNRRTAVCAARPRSFVTKSCSVQLNFEAWRASTQNFITEATERVEMLTHVGVCLH